MKHNIVHKIIVPCVLVGSLLFTNIIVQASEIYLKLGQQNEQVRQLQVKLKSLGYFSGTPTGYYGEMTEASVKWYQNSNGLSADGVVGNGTWDTLFSSNTASTESTSNTGVLLKEGMQGEQIKQLQLKLKSLGYFSDEATGYYGDITVNAVKWFQNANGFTPDGVVGSQTWNTLFQTAQVSSSQVILKEGNRSEKVRQAQEKLKELGYFNTNPTGYFGRVTTTSVVSFQKANNLSSDGVIGQTTWDKLFSGTSVASQNQRVVASRGASHENPLVSWNVAKDIFSIGTVATIIDINTGIQYQVKRTFGTSHADVEPLTAEDTRKLKQTYGGQWSWSRRPVVVIINGRRIAGSTNGMPHAGVDWQPSTVVVANRSGGYGTGQNLDAVKGNGMDGQVCIHFLNSRTHGGGSVDSQHQAAIMKAANWIENN